MNFAVVLINVTILMIIYLLLDLGLLKKLQVFMQNSDVPFNYKRNQLTIVSCVLSSLVVSIYRFRALLLYRSLHQ